MDRSVESARIAVLIRKQHSLLWITILLSMGSAVRGEEDRPPRAAITPEVSLVAAKRLEGAREFLELEQWTAAVDALEGLSASFGDALVEVEPGRFLNVNDVCLATIAGMPPEGLAVYRQRVDAAAEVLYEEAGRQDDPIAMRQMSSKYFPGSYGDDALWWLAEDAWAHGDLDRARMYWTQLLPVNPSAAEPPLVLRYPDAEFPTAAILARLVLCSIMQRDLTAARSELHAFRRLYPGETGELAGRKGVLCEILAEVLVAADEWGSQALASGCSTFACGPSRNGVFESLPNGLEPVWRTGLSRSEVPAVSGLRPPSLTEQTPGVFPVVWNGVVVIQDHSTIRALALESGAPAWPSGRPDDRGVIHEESDPGSIQVPALGIAWQTGTASEGRYYTRVGPSLFAAAAGSLRRVEDRLIALDLASGEGRLAWETTTEELLHEEGWRFTGAPLAVDDRLYVPLRRAEHQIEVAVACINAGTAELIWRQRAAIDLESPPETWHRRDHELLCYAAGSLYFAPQAGLVMSLDADSGVLNWVAAYPSYPLTPAETAHPAHAGLLPPVFNRGTVYVAPRDSAHVTAFDAATGVVRWQTRKPGRINALLGITENLLVAGGDRLWRFQADTGTLEKPFGYDDPTGFGFGRGVIAGESIYWTTREELFEVDVSTGRAVRRLPLELLGVDGGGNLVIADGHLLFAEPDRLTVFGMR